MANSSQITTSLQALTQNHLSNVLINTQFDIMPALYLLAAKDGDKSGKDNFKGLGRPGSAVFLGGVNLSKPKREEIIGSLVYQPIIQTSTPAITDGKAMGQRSTLPTVANSDTLATPTYFSRPRFKFCEVADPYKVWKKDVRHTTRAAPGDNARAWEAIGSVMKAETVSRLAIHQKRLNGMLYGTLKPSNATNLGYPTSEDADTWDNIHSFTYAIGTLTNTYGGVDRTVAANAYWLPPDTSGYGTVFEGESLVNYVNYDLGLAAKGQGIEVVLVGGTLFKKVKLEAKAKGYQMITSGGIPDFGAFGFKRELVKIDNTWFVYDPTVPSGVAVCLNPSTWTFVVHPDANFTISEPFDQSKIEGGDDALAGNLRTQVIWACEAPSLNAYFTGLT